MSSNMHRVAAMPDALYVNRDGRRDDSVDSMVEEI